jgi:hypothetical protein
MWVGGYTKFNEEGLNNSYLPVWLQDAGYNTYYAGKLMNGHATLNYDDPYVNGFNSSAYVLCPELGSTLIVSTASFSIRGCTSTGTASGRPALARLKASLASTS